MEKIFGKKKNDQKASKLNETTNPQIQETQPTLKRRTPRHIKSQLNQVVKKEKEILKVTKGKMECYTQRNKDKHDSKLLIRNNASKKRVEQHLQHKNNKYCQPRILPIFNIKTTTTIKTVDLEFCAWHKNFSKIKVK